MAEEITVRLDLLTGAARKEVKKFGSATEREFDRTGAAAGRSKKSITSLGKSSAISLGKAGVAGAAAAAGAAFTKFTSDAIKKGMEFESTLADLSAITGITGDSLRDLGATAVEQSIKTGVAARDQVESMKLVASQLADAIDFDTEAGQKQLKAVAQDAITLSKAAGIDLRSATEVATSAINQFGLEASESTRVINTLAAGSKFGAAEVGDIGAAMKESGASFAAARQPIEAANAGIQILAQNAIRGSQAGTNLRNVVTILQTETQKLADAGINNVNVKTDGFAGTLQKLRPLLDDTTALTKIFGRENITAAQILIRNADAVENMQGKVTGTATAMEQYNTQQNTLQADTAKLSAAYDALAIAFFENIQPALRGTTQLTTALVSGLSDLFNNTVSISGAYTQLESKVQNLTTSTPALISQYETLTSQTSLSEEEQRKLDTITAQLADQLPGRAIAWNQMGEAIGVNTEAAKEYIVQQKELLRLQNAEQIQEQLEALKSFRSQLDITNQSVEDGLISREKANRQLQETRGQIKQTLSNLDQLGADLTDNSAKFDVWWGAFEGEVDVAKIVEEVGYLTEESSKAADTAAKAGEDTRSAAEQTENSTKKAAESAWNMSDALDSVKGEYDELLNQAGTLSGDEKNRLSTLRAQIRYYEKIKELRETGRSVADLDTSSSSPTEAIESPTLGGSEGGLFGDTEEGQGALDHEGLKNAEQEYTDAVKQHAQERAAARAAEWQKTGAAATNVIDKMLQYQAVANQNRINDIEEERDKKVEQINAELEKEELSEERRAELLAKRQELQEKTDQKIAQIKKSQAKKEKAWMTGKAIANTAIGITKAFADFGPIVGAIMAGLVAAAGAIQVATIQAQPIPYAKGGRVPVKVSNGERYISPEDYKKNAAFYEEANAAALQPGTIRGPGTGTSDSINAMAEEGSFILNEKANRNLERSSFAGGGFVSGERQSTTTGNSAPERTVVNNYMPGERETTMDLTPVVEELQGLRRDIQTLRITTDVTAKKLYTIIQAEADLQKDNSVTFD